jgi:hypothetical protein
VITGLFQYLSKIKVAEPEYPCGTSRNYCQIVRVPVPHTNPDEDATHHDKVKQATAEVIAVIDRTLWIGQRFITHEGGFVTRGTSGLLQLAASQDFDLADLRVAELRSLTYLDYTSIPHSHAGEYIWEGGLWIPPKA